MLKHLGIKHFFAVNSRFIK